MDGVTHKWGAIVNLRSGKRGQDHTPAADTQVIAAVYRFVFRMSGTDPHFKHAFRHMGDARHSIAPRQFLVNAIFNSDGVTVYHVAHRCLGLQGLAVVCFTPGA